MYQIITFSSTSMAAKRSPSAGLPVAGTGASVTLVPHKQVGLFLDEPEIQFTDNDNSLALATR
jgi:hypothetical protein